MLRVDVINDIHTHTRKRQTQTDVFDIVAFGGTATFKRNTEGKVIAVQIVVGDVNMEGTKSDGTPLFIQKQSDQSFAKAFFANTVLNNESPFHRLLSL